VVRILLAEFSLRVAARHQTDDGRRATDDGRRTRRYRETLGTHGADPEGYENGEHERKHFENF
jgi:hypothetical protein